jgi:hypothetical protein
VKGALSLVNIAQCIGAIVEERVNTHLWGVDVT